MAMIDNNLIFDTNAAITTTRDSTNVIDLTVAEDLGLSEDTAAIDVIIQIATTMVSATTTATLVAAIEGSTNSTTYTILAETDPISTASLTAGTNILNIQIPSRRLTQPAGAQGGDPAYRYLKINYLCSAAFSAGNVTAWLGGGKQATYAYPSGFTVAN